MAIYKPNNFYPYMQEVDLESDEGVIFSCQANTDGGSMVRAARLRILDKDKNVVLYEKIQNLDYPVRNGEIVEFKLEPYMFNPKYIVNFVSLTPQSNIFERIKYCPYNFYQDQIYGFKHFNILRGIEKESDINPDDIIYSWENIIDYKVEFNSNNEYKLISDIVYNESDIIKVTLKNNKEFIWDIELFEHEINTEDYDGTYICNGVISGSVENYLLIDRENQDDNALSIYKNNQNSDLWVDIKFNTENSNFFQEEIKKGYVMSGDLSLYNNEEIIESDTNNSIGMDGNFYFISEGIYTDSVSYYDRNDGRYRAAAPIPGYSGYYIFGDFYKRENGIKKLKENFLKLPYYSFKIGYSQTAGNGAYNYPAPHFFHRNIFDTTSSFGYVDILKTNYREDYSTNTENVWRYVENITIKTEDENIKLEINNNTYINNDLYGICHRVGKLESVIDAVQNNNYIDYPFACRTCETQVIATDIPVKDNTEGSINKIAFNNENFSINAYSDELIYVIDEKCYRIRVLTPCPIDFSIGDTRHHTNGYCTKEPCGSGIFKFIDKPSSTMSRNYSQIHGLISEISKILNNTDYECLTDENGIKFNSVEDIFNKHSESFVYCYYNEYDNSTKEYHQDLAFETTQLDNSSLIHFSKGYCDSYHYPVTAGAQYEVIVSGNNQDVVSISVYEDDQNILKNVTINKVEEIENINSEDNTAIRAIRYKIKIPLMYKEPMLKVKFSNPKSYKSLLRTYGNERGTIDVKIKYISSEDKKYIKLSDNNVDISSIYENLSLNIYNNDNTNSFDELKIKKFIPFNNLIELYDSEKEKEIISLIENNEIMNYDFFYHQREMIGWQTSIKNSIYDILKLETINPFDYYLNNNEKIFIYNTDSKTTKNSFFGKKSLEYNVDNLYIRFPEYNGYDYAGNQLTDCIYSKLIEPYEDKQKIPHELFQKTEGTIDMSYHYYKLFKVTSYNLETGEFVIAGGLSRDIFLTDSYEIWERTIIEGSSNDYDITEADSTYCRIFPKYDDLTTISYLNEEPPLFLEGFSILTTNPTLFFITPNNQILNSEYNSLYFQNKKDQSKIYLKQNFEKAFYETKNLSILKLDNSQWLIPVDNNFFIYDDYEVFQDSVRSNTNYFYSRNLEQLSLYCVNINDFNNNLDDFKIDIYSILKNSNDEYAIISSMDFYIIGEYNHQESLKRYCLKVYDSNMNLLYDSKDIYDDQILYRIKGLNNELYYMIIECENELGNITVYEQMFIIQYLEQESQVIKLNIENDCKQSGVIVSFVDESNNYCTIDDFINNEINENAIIAIYRKSQDGNIKWIYDIDLQKDKVFYGYFDNDYKYSFIDYNVGNDEKYEYYAVLKFIQISDTVNSYLFAKGEIITSFDSWTLVDVIEDKDGLYSAIGDVWSFRYNLESEDLVQNTSITTWDTLGRYGQVGKGEKNYISSGLRCLLGDISYYNTYNNDNQIIKKYGYNEKHENIEKKVTVNNITKYKKWQKFCNSFSKKLLKDLKGNKWIVQIVENPTVSNADTSKEQLYTISFNWQEILDSEQISVCNKLEDIKQDIDIKTKIEGLAYYNDENIIPTSETSFIFEIDNETMTASIALLDQSSVYNTSKKMTIANVKTGLNEIVVPYKYNKEGNEYLVTNIKDNAFNNKNLKSVILPNSIKNIGISSFANNKDLINIIIPNSVETIGNNAFENCISLNNITIPEKIININNGVFNHCESLTEIVIPFGVISIEQNAFRYCKKLNNIKIPDSINFIGDSAFEGCESLTEVIIPDKITSINNSIFKDCTLLKNITIPNTVTNIREKAFYNCNQLLNITDITRVINIGNSAFEGCSSLTSFTIPTGVTDINNSTFKNCSGLMNINIHNGITSIGDSAFFGCVGLNTIDIPENVTAIGVSAFEGCSGLSSIIIPESVSVIGNNAFNGCTNLNSLYYNYYTYSISEGSAAIIDVSTDISGDIEIPSTIDVYIINTIKSSAFKDCTEIISIIMPDSITNIDEGIFYGCKNLKTINLSKNITSIGKNMFWNCTSLTNIIIPDSVTTIGDSAFSGCKSLTNITIPNGVITIERGAFRSCINLTNITIPDSVTNIGDATFSGCTSLTDITIPNVVTSIGDSVFSGCKSLTDITIPNGVTSIGDSVFSGCTSLTDITIPNGITSIGDSVFYGCTSLTNIIIPNSVTSISNSAFYNCDSLTNIIIPDSVTSIGDEAFYSCDSLTNIIIPNGVTSIGDNVFYGCTNLTDITIPNGVTSIGAGAFWNCTSLTDITIPNNVTSIGDKAFCNCTSLTDITIPNVVTSIGDSVFYGCKSLTDITIPNGVTSIGDSAFSGCTNLTNIIIPDSVTSIGYRAFYGCNHVTVYYKGTEEQWSLINIGEYNNRLYKEGSIIYNYQSE